MILIIDDANVSDPYFASVKMLFGFEDSGSNQTNESGPSAYGTARAGVSHVTTPTPIAGSRCLGQFTNSGTFRTNGMAGNAALQPGTGAFTCEMLFYGTSADDGLVYECANSPASGVAGLFLRVNADGSISAGQAFGSTIVQSATSLLTLNTWHYLCVQRYATSHPTFPSMWALILNNAVVATATNAVNLSGTGETYTGGTGRASSEAPSCYIDEVRFTNGVARHDHTTYSAMPSFPFPRQ